MRPALLVCCATVLAAGVTGCGGSSVPDPPVCPTTPVAAVGFRQYTTSVRNLADRLKSLYDAERATFPSRSFSGRSDFRSTFIAFADDSVCTATELAALDAPSNNTRQLDSALDAAVDDYIAHTEAGRAGRRHAKQLRVPHVVRRRRREAHGGNERRSRR